MKLPLFDQLSLFFTPQQPPPEKKRHILLGSRLVEYTLRQAPRRRLTLNINERGLRVAAPRSISITGIDDFIRANANWVISKLDEYACCTKRQLTIRHGQRLPVLGDEVEIRVVTGRNRICWHNDGTLVLEARADADLDALARRALQRRAHELFSQRMEHYGRSMTRPIPALSLSSARTRWGSCSATGIRLNWRLIHLPLHLIDYVVAHELAHLEQMNHSPRFWAVVERLYPGHKNARAELKRCTAELPVI
ncbi:MAG: SprT family zinc-dependent metalloprotease [Georgfuchsia sp.]